MKKVSAILFALAIAGAAYAQNTNVELNVGSPTAHEHVKNTAGGGGSASNLLYHTGGVVIPVAHVVDIFWGPSFNDTTSPDYNYARTLQNFRNQFGTTPEFNTITQYYQVIGGTTSYVQLSNLQGSQPDWFDTTTPPTNVTDAIVQQEVQRYVALPLTLKPPRGHARRCPRRSRPRAGAAARSAASRPPRPRSTSSATRRVRPS